MDRWVSFRLLAIVASGSVLTRIVLFRMLGWENPHRWREICAMIGGLILFWIGTQKIRRRSDLQMTALLGALLLLVSELPFVSNHLFGFLQTDRSFLELFAVVPMGLCLLLCYFALLGMMSERPD
jgi:hypothetical protein